MQYSTYLPQNIRVIFKSEFTIPYLEKPHPFSKTKYFFGNSINSSKHFFKNSSKTLIIIITIFVLLISIFAIQRILTQPPMGDSVSQVDGRVNLNGPILKKTINKTFSFPLLDQNGKEVSRFTYTVDNVELRDQIIVKGQQASAIKGKRFFVINIKLTNNFDKTINVNARDYIRVIVSGSSEKLAPDMHSDPVEVQPISTKLTRLGMTINENDTKIVLQVGEINGKKESIPVNLK